VYFQIGESNVLPESFEQLDNLVTYLKENFNLKIQIEGHTDNQGDSKANKKLSLERAYNVREYLVSKGIAGKRIKFVGLGDVQPISANDTEESRKLNRRVEYKIID
jgi:outer membrane protein OmpA-like peptidoglycan-associated protein